MDDHRDNKYFFSRPLPLSTLPSFTLSLPFWNFLVLFYEVGVHLFRTIILLFGDLSLAIQSRTTSSPITTHLLQGRFRSTWYRRADVNLPLGTSQKHNSSNGTYVHITPLLVFTEIAFLSHSYGGLNATFIAFWNNLICFFRFRSLVTCTSLFNGTVVEEKISIDHNIFAIPTTFLLHYIFNAAHW